MNGQGPTKAPPRQLVDWQFDIHQRYSFLARLLAAMFTEATKVTVLDVGAGPTGLAEAFLPPRFHITTADVQDFGRTDIVRLVPGAPLPFADGAVAVTMAMDVLEHVPAEQRSGLIVELCRVAAHTIVLSFPNDDPAVREAETALDRVFIDTFGDGNAFLAEHKALGLPAANDVLATLAAAGFDVLQWPNCPLPEWLLYSALDVAYFSLHGDGTEKAAFNARVNTATSQWCDHGGHYRTFVLASRDRQALARADAAALACRSQSSTTTTRLAATATAALADLSAGQRTIAAAEAARMATRLEQLRAETANKDEALRQKDLHIQKLETLLQQSIAQKDTYISKLKQLLRRAQSAG
ncbi:MAG TPA: class I SAM-dependent methyltransferase [Planctomycetota bacterium]|nr:class I SAM-dependent methyltransferase [Planctomycetota bacterium]